MPGRHWHYEGVTSRTVILAPAALVALLALGPGAAHGRAIHVAVAGASAPEEAALTPSLCPPGELPDGEVCVVLPGDDEGPEEEPESNAHHDKRGHWIVYDQIPRRPERPADYDAYRFPVSCAHGCVVSGYDLDRPDDAQRRGRRLSHVGHGAV